MNGPGNFTHKAQEAILTAQDTARQAGQQQIDALHLLLALVSQEGSVVLTLLQKIGVDIENLKKKAKAALEKIPTIATPQTWSVWPAKVRSVSPVATSHTLAVPLS